MNRRQPPVLLHRFFRWFCHPDYREDIEGDLVERFEKRVAEGGEKKAKWLFAWEVVRLFRPEIIKPIEGTQKLNYYGMFRNDLKLAFRNLKRHKTYVVINLLGMGFALMCCTVAFLNLDYKLRFDEHHAAKTQDVYRVNTVRVNAEGKEPWGLAPQMLSSVLEKDITGIEKVIRLESAQGIVSANEKTFSETLLYADPELLNVFNFPLIYGNVSVSGQPTSVVLSEETAHKYFGDENPIGKEISIFDGQANKKTFNIGAVAQEIPKNTSVLFTVLVPFEDMGAETGPRSGNWTNSPQITLFVKTTAGADPTRINEQLANYAAVSNEFNDEAKVASFYLQPFKELALTSDIDLPGWVRGRALNRNAVGFLVGITTFLSVMILLVACFNFANTSIAFSGNRLKEIGIRKVIGGTRWRLVKQFMVENILLCFLSILLGLFGAYYLIDGYNAMFEQNLDMQYILRFRVLAFLVGFPMVVAVLAGGWPAFKISSHEPVAILKGKTRFASMGWISKTLLTAQFSLACFAIIGAAVLTQNAAYQQTVDFGYRLREVVVANVNSLEEFTLFQNELSQSALAKRIAGSADIIGNSQEVPVKVEKDGVEIKARQLRVGTNYLETVGISLVEGRPFMAGSAQDQQKSVIINKKMAESVKSNGSAVDQQIFINEVPYRIIGVVENHKEFGLMQEEPPCLFTEVGADQFRFLSVSSSKDNLAELTGFLPQAWYNVNPNIPFSGFTQETLIFKQLYINTIIRNLCLFLAVATLIMSAAGFFSIVSLSIQKRTKEIAIRKVFGGSVVRMIRMMSGDFTRYIFIAYTIGALLAGFVVKAVLFQQIYVFHPPLGVGAFVFTLLIMLLVPGLTVGIKVYNAASANPADTLRNE
jgi:putative ABC transport system permease protein